jgi:large subunit ribosomal protein L6
MSRTGKNPVNIPEGTSVEVQGNVVKAKGKLGELQVSLSSLVSLEKSDNEIVFTPANNSKQARTLWGTSRSLVNGIVTGVSEGFERKLEINGVGYRAQMKGKDLVLQLGYSHEVVFTSPEEIQISVEGNIVIIKGIDKQKVGSVASKIRSFRKPEPYKGKGVKYLEETILRKEGKKK